MKPTLLLLFVFTFLTTTFAQNRSNFYHKIKKEDIDSGYLKLIYRDKSGASKDISVCGKYLKGIITLDKGVPVIDFWSITDDKYSSQANCISNNTELGRFEIDLTPRNKVGDPTNYIVVPFRAWTWGVGATPFRYRPKTEASFSTISTSLGVTINYGRTFGWSTISPRAINNFSITVGPFIGLSSVDLKKSTVKSPTTWTTDRTNAAFTYGINSIFARNNFGLVLSLGFDNNFGENSKEWSYQNRPWFGIGINTSLGIF
ncbi:hypothetical protein SAMN05444377_1066 [Flavobacterium fontis]|uniref:Outer membrane protein beta-barrel domain-containing protein n=1 Tax=Flavobacterium fontis TaxID=1124188 RepID=A0A1M5ABN2_9FLAO|nr:hypothetical protein [Flavobacterium fontis]SHF27708.1 hypothetical protein SAMN05444377_1066 [Flavobacterium fontis]